MKSRKHLVLNILSYLALIVGVSTGYWGVSSVVFYFCIEIAINTVLAAFFFKDNQGQRRIIGVLGAGVFMQFVALSAGLFTSILSGEMFYVSGEYNERLLAYAVSMLRFTWPIIVLRLVGVIYEVYSTDKKRFEERIFAELIHNVLSLMGVMLLCLILFTVTKITSPVWAIFGIITFRTLLDLYLYRSVMEINSTGKY